MIRSLGLALAVLTLLAGAAHARGVEPFDPFGLAGIDQHPGAAIPLDRPFLDQSGRPTTLAALAGGKPLVVTPVQHRCPNLCGLTLEGVRKALDGQDYRAGKDFVLVALGIDPREGEDAAAVSAERLGGGSGVYALTGRAADIAAVTRALGYRYAWDERSGQYAHVAASAVLTPQGRLSRWLFGVAPPAGDLHLALTEAGGGRIGGLVDQVLLFCYHYDPQTGRYSSLIWTLLRVGGGVAVAGLGGLIGFSILRDNRRRRGDDA